MKRIIPAIFGWLYLTSGAHAQPLVFGYSAITSVFLAQEAAKNPQAKNFTAEQFYDNSLVQELINENFFKALWGK